MPDPNLCWEYDNFGNRLLQYSATAAFASGSGGPNGCTLSGEAGPTAWANYNSGANQMSSTNQTVASDPSMSYDAAGNIQNDGNYQYLYDGDERLCAVAAAPINGGSSVTQYLYDAEGNRVAKGSAHTVLSSGQYVLSCDTTANGFAAQTVYVVGASGEQLSELTSGSWQVAHTNVYASGQQVTTYDADPTASTEGWLYFHLSDWLGTRRQQTNYAGNPCRQFTGLPFGDGLTPTTVGSGCGDATEHHFTGKERDTESGNDYFGARYYASSMGRMLSPDPVSGTLIHIMNPQRWNMYAYALNNPLNMTDPTGKDAAAVNFSGMVGGFGHEALVSINSDGSAQFASYGPAKMTATGGWGLSEPGQVQTQTLPSIQFGADGLPTDSSMTALKNAVATIEGVGPTTVNINYFKTTPQETASLNAWIAQQKAHPGQYHLCSTNCANFTKQGLVAGGAITQSQANGLSIVPNDEFNQLENYTPENSDSNGNAKVTATATNCVTGDDGQQHCDTQ